jgi:hypothetical protein
VLPSVLLESVGWGGRLGEREQERSATQARISGPGCERMALLGWEVSYTRGGGLRYKIRGSRFGGRIVDYFRLIFAYSGEMFDPDAAVPRPNRTLIYLGACVIAGLRLARATQVNVRVIPDRHRD